MTLALFFHRKAAAWFARCNSERSGHTDAIQMQRGTVRSIIIYICSSVIFSKLFELCVISDLVSFGLDLPSPNGRYDLQGLRQMQQ